jgi:BMFP domain-containing protein YqiC
MSDKNEQSTQPKPESGATADPLEAWRKLRDANLEMWSRNLIEAVNSDAYAKMTGGMLDTYLTASAPFRDSIAKSMTQALQQLNLPTREDFESLAQRMTNIEMQLDDLSARLEAKAQKMGGK